VESQNGWSVITNAKGTKWWNAGEAKLQLRPGAAGFLLCHLATWFDQRMERLGADQDDFGWSLRRIAGTDIWSNHSSATAVDLNASKHPQGERGTFSTDQVLRIEKRLEEAYEHKIVWGGNYHTLPDEMHWEIQGTFDEVKILVAKLRDTPIGKQVIEAN
jgi:hypothetical protein